MSGPGGQDPPTLDGNAVDSSAAADATATIASTDATTLSPRDALPILDGRSLTRGGTASTWSGGTIFIDGGTAAGAATLTNASGSTVTANSTATVTVSSNAAALGFTNAGTFTKQHSGTAGPTAIGASFT